AEDGIRDGHVTGVQTCALPISCRSPTRFRSTRVATTGEKWCCIHGLSLFQKQTVKPPGKRWLFAILLACIAIVALLMPGHDLPRSEERRVGKECRSRWSRVD